MFAWQVLRTLAVCAALVALSACDSAEDRAQKHYENGLRLVEEGDFARAIVEFRNAVALDEGNPQLRLAFGKAARLAGNISESYTQYLRVVEARPDNTEARLALTEMAIGAQNWEEAERHGAVLIEANAELEGTETAKLALEFREAVLAENPTRMRELTREAETLFETRPEDPILQRLLIEGYASDGRIEDALRITDLALKQDPTNRPLYMTRAQLLHRSGDPEGLERHLRQMVENFPDDTEIKALLIQQLASEGKIADAETFLRDELAAADEPTNVHVSLIVFLRQVHGNEAALEELDTAIATYEDNALFRALRASILFEQHDTQGAITEMQGVIDGAEPGEETDRFKVTLARMLGATGNDVGARALVEEVLERDGFNVDALKMQARWSIDGDRPEVALEDLRKALDRQPEDPEALMLMSDAHQRNGNPELARDMMALAVEASDNAPRESLAFASSLAREDRLRPAEDVLVRALRKSPNSVDLLVMLGQVHVASEDWARAEQVEAALRRLDTDESVSRAEELRFQIFGRREGRDRAIAYLEGLAQSDEASAASVIALIQSHLAEGKGDEALALARQLVEREPDNPRFKTVLGNTHAALSQFDEAEQVIRGALDESGDPVVALQLVRLLGSQARVDESKAVLDAAIEANPEHPDLLWLKATFLEQSNDIDGAIAIYERLYERDTSSALIANNLASLLATYKTDEESLNRAFRVARRLNGTDVPAFQDTYGWILYRRGEHDEAVRYLEPAAEALQRDPIVQYHLAKAYQAVGREEDAMAAFRNALAVANADDTRAQIAEAREAVSADGGGNGNP